MGIYSVSIAPSPGGILLPRATIDPNRETTLDLADERVVFFLKKTPKATLNEHIS